MESPVLIDPNHEYRPSEVADNGWILNNEGKKDYKFILKLIKYDKLKARNICVTGKVYWRVLGQAIIDYIDQLKHAYDRKENDQEQNRSPKNLSSNPA